MVQIEISGGFIALVDDCDSGLSMFRWHKEVRNLRDGKQIVYASRKSPRPSREKIYMHREVMGFPNGDVDHRDGDGINNQRSNLRTATRSQNMGAMREKKRISKYRGVVPSPVGRWIAQITVCRKVIYLGTFDSQEDAGKAYNEAALSGFGEFARLNVITRETLKELQ